MRGPCQADPFQGPDATHRRARSPLSPPEPKPRWYELLIDLWRDTTQDELDRRFAVGRLLNDEIALPDDKQPPCADRLLKAVAKLLNQTRADLKLMRWLPTRFDSAAALRAEYPDAVTWDAVKKLLRPAARKGAAMSGRATRRRRSRWRGEAANAPAAATPDSAPAGGGKRYEIVMVAPPSGEQSPYPPGVPITIKEVPRTR
jgi:hypothetical protein